MGSTALCQVLMMVLTVCVWRGDGQYAVSNTPSWPTTGCSFTRHEGIELVFGWYNIIRALTTEDGCESRCRSEARCGSYAWYRYRGDQFCYLYQHTNRLMEDLTGIPEEEWRPSHPHYNVGSKDCEANISDTVCDNYIGHDRKFPYARYRITYVAQYPAHNLTAAMCQSMCDAHDTCVSVRYTGGCDLYNTTIRELIDSGRENEIYTSYNTRGYPILITYDCDITTTPTETTTPQIDCTNLTGALLCLPIGYGDEATCQAIPGCCFLKGTIAGEPYTMCLKAD